MVKDVDTTNRYAALGIENSKSTKSKNIPISGIADRLSDDQQSSLIDNSALIRWDGSGFVAETKVGGEYSTTKTTGATNAIQVVLAEKFRDTAIAKVEFDESISSQNFMQIVENYQRSMPLAGGGGRGGDGGGGWFRIAAGDEPNGKKPNNGGSKKTSDGGLNSGANKNGMKLITFSRRDSQDKIEILDTPAGRAKLLFAKSTNRARQKEILEQDVTQSTKVNFGPLHIRQTAKPVSYTHLTLPTIYSV